MQRSLITILILAALAMAGCYPVLDTSIPANQAIVEARRTPAPQALPVPLAEPVVVPVEPTAQAIEIEEEGQVDCNIAGNINRAGEKIYHLPTGAYWSQVRIDLERGEEWLCSENEAIEKGYRKSGR